MMYTYVHGGDIYTASGKKNLLIILQILIRLACRSL